MKKIQMGAVAGILFPLSVFALVSISTKYSYDPTATDSAYVAKLIEQTSTIQFAAGMGLLSVVLLLIHLEWLTGVVSKHAPFSAKVARSCGQIAAIGVSLTYGLTFLAAEGASEDWPDQAVQAVSQIGGSIGWVLMGALGAFAGVIAFQGWKGKFPKWIALLATLETLIVVIATGAGELWITFMPTMVWLLINAVGLLFHERKTA